MQRGCATLIGRAFAASVLATNRGWRLAGAGPEEMPTARGIATSISCRAWQGSYDPARGSSSAVSSWRQSFSTLHEGVELRRRQGASLALTRGCRPYHGSFWLLRGDREKASAGSDAPAWITGHFRWEVQRDWPAAAYGLSPITNATVAPSKSQRASVGNVGKSLRIAKPPHIRAMPLAEIGSLICSGETFDGEGCSAGCG
jgi:hypothetical protein